MIHFGDIEYFTLLELQQRLKAYDYDKLDLENLDRLRAEVDRKVAAINLQEKQRKETITGK
jgi:phenylalanyl-tRNA synthetase beta subunit